MTVPSIRYSENKISEKLFVDIVNYSRDFQLWNRQAIQLQRFYSRDFSSNIPNTGCNKKNGHLNEQFTPFSTIFPSISEIFKVKLFTSTSQKQLTFALICCKMLGKIVFKGVLTYIVKGKFFLLNPVHIFQSIQWILIMARLNSTHI